jgi:hypothetical protein
MRIQRHGIERATRHRIHSHTDTFYDDSWVTLVRIHNFEPTPVPELHIYLAEAVLVIASNDESAPHARELACELKRLLLAHGFDDPLTSHPAG